MEGFRYVDIFATKGIEYLLVIGFLLTFLIVWRMLGTPAPTKSGKAGLKARLRPGEWFRFDPSLHYHQGHAWAAPIGRGRVRVGMDDFAHKLLGEADSFELPAVGSRLTQGERGWGVNVRSKPIDVLSPVGGEVVALNERALETPGSTALEPYGDGWLLEVKLDGNARGLRNLLRGRYARAWLSETANAIRERMAGDLGVVLQDGGSPVSGFAVNLDPDDWDTLAREFLMTEREEEC